MSVSQQPGPLRYAGQPSAVSRSETTNLAELLERILDKGLIIAGDISIRLVDVELLTIKLRLLIASVDKAQEMGIDWWRSDPWLSSRANEHSLNQGPSESRQLEGGEDHAALLERVHHLEAALEQLQAGEGGDRQGGQDKDGPKRQGRSSQASRARSAPR